MTGPSLVDMTDRELADRLMTDAMAARDACQPTMADRLEEAARRLAGPQFDRLTAADAPTFRDFALVENVTVPPGELRLVVDRQGRG